MGIWQMMADPNEYRTLSTPGFSPSEQLEIGSLFRSGDPLGRTWRPFQVELWGNGDEENKPIGDFPSIAGMAPLAISERALAMLYPLIKDQVEVLDLITEPAIGKFYALNVFFADCLDRDKSVFVHYTEGGIMDIEQYAFREGCLEGKHIFRLAEIWTCTFVDDRFKLAVEENGLQGLIFYQVPEVDAGSTK